MEVRDVLELTKIPYVAFFSYGEKLPVLTHGTTDPEGIGYYYEKIADLLESDFKNVEAVFPGGDQRVGAGDWKTVVHRRDRYQTRGGFLGEPFEHDFYVSYSHGAHNGQRDTDLMLWSQKFAKDLRAELAGSREFEDISVFLDESDRSDESVAIPEQLADLLRNRVTNSALLVIVMTPYWLRSKWCRQEFEWWCEKHHPDSLDADGRIFICRVRQSSEADWPEPIQDLLGYFCYDRDKKPEMARPFAWRGSTRDLVKYIDSTDEYLSRHDEAPARAQGRFEQRRERDDAEAALFAASGQVIYLHARENSMPRPGNAHAMPWRMAASLVFPTEPDPIAREPTLVQDIARAPQSKP